MSSIVPIKVIWPEDGSAIVLGRVTSHNGSGAVTGKDGEGNFTKQEDLTSITVKVLQQDEFGALSETTPAPTVVIANAILDVPRDIDSNVLWVLDGIGYNFIFHVASLYFPTKGKIVRVEFTYSYDVANNSAIGHGVYEGPVGGPSGGLEGS